MIYGSTFSGIGGLDAGLHRAGLRAAFLCESDEWRRSILAERFPGVPVYEDVRDLGDRSSRPEDERGAGSGPRDSEGRPDVHARPGEQTRGCDLREGAEGSRPGGLRAVGGSGAGEHVEPEGRDSGDDVDLLVGGFPCQDVSVAGKRAGFKGERSSLFFEFARIAGELVRPGGYVLVENVPGLFSSHEGRDFAAVLGTLADLGFHDLAWRVLDSQFFGVPQRRRRVFILARRARGVRCAEILLEPESRGGDPPTRAETREGSAGTLGGGAGQRGWSPDTDRMTFLPAISPALKARDGKGPSSDGDGDGATLVTGFHMTQDPISVEDGVPAWGKDNKQGTASVAVSNASGVRRLTPTECERLQGLPDGWTLPGSDSKRYAGLGDAVTANVAEWIGKRLMEANP